MTNDPESMGILKHAGPLHPQYATPEARARTFRDWPPALSQKPGDLAEAGFYYIGRSDQVIHRVSRTSFYESVYCLKCLSTV